MPQQALTKAEFAALKQLGLSFSRGTIIHVIRDRLMALGYARELMGNLMITNAGNARLTGHRA